MSIRTEHDKTIRKDQDKKKDTEYKNYYLNNPEIIQLCKCCEEEKPLKNFLPTYFFRMVCKSCHRNKVKKNRLENRDKTKQNVVRNGNKSATFVMGLKIGKVCKKCNKNFPPSALDFHHVSSKNWSISMMYGKSKDRILEEIKNCILLCANCHRSETQISAADHVIQPTVHPYSHKEIQCNTQKKKCKKCEKILNVDDFSTMYNGYKHSYCIPCKRKYERDHKRTKISPTREFLRDYKSNHPCVDCSQKFEYWQMDFDHVTDQKLKNLNKLQLNNIEIVKKEIEKCELVCAACHRIRTFNWRRAAKICGCGYRPKSLADLKNHNSRCDISEKVCGLSPDRIQALIDNVYLKDCELEKASEFLNKYHYAGYGRSASINYAFWWDNEMVAVVKFSPTVRKEVATSLGWGVNQVLELDRFCIRPKWQHKNLGSKIMSLVIRQVRIDFPDVLVLISFSDPDQGHIGTLYAASNWIKVGETATSYFYVDEDGNEHNKKTIYERARKMGKTEREYASDTSLVKHPTGSKIKFIYELR